MRNIFLQCCVLLLIFTLCNNGSASEIDTITPRHNVTLPEAHIGNKEIDTTLLDSYLLLPENVRLFYLEARSVFSGTSDANFTNSEIIAAARKHNIDLMGGPLLGKLSEKSVNIWLRPATADSLVVKVKKLGSEEEKSYIKNSVEPGVELRIAVDGLSPATKYEYTIHTNNHKVAEGRFATAPVSGQKSTYKVAFGSCFHKIGLHNPNLIHQIVKREPQSMMLLGDIAVDDRENKMNMHRSDYLLRDVSEPWRELAANVPLYATWDDHDYYNNDLSGTPQGFTSADREAAREVWQQNWNNPENKKPGIYFNTRTGPVELIMLDTRSCRNNEQRGQFGSYLGTEQLSWLKTTLKNSSAPFKIISSGTMWSDYVTNGKDSWGTWDTIAREELFTFIESEKISGVLLISGDRHGARAFTIPRPSGFKFYEFEAASLGGVPGPDALAQDTTNQIFGYHGTSVIAFGEFTFITSENQPSVTFRLIDQYGKIREEYTIPYDELTP